MSSLGEGQIVEGFVTACRAEIAALKPGNVHIHAAGHGMEAAQFEAAAVAAAPFIADQRLRVGERIRRAVEASFAASGCNTNLGILLLCVPLAVAAEQDGPAKLRDRLRAVLAALDADDAANVYAAIRRANPGGLGDAPSQDIAEAPTVGLLEAMRLAIDRDRIAQNYVTAFDDIFSFGLPELARARHFSEDEGLAITTLHMAYLARFPDSHIARKKGPATAKQVMAEARELAPLSDPVAQRSILPWLLDFDADLKARGLNPGTTADLVVGTLFASFLCDALGLSSAP